MQISRTRAERNDPKQWAATAGSMQPAIKRAVAAFMDTYQPWPRDLGPRPAQTYRIARRNAAKVARRAAA